MLQDPSPITGFDWGGLLGAVALYGAPAIVALVLGFRSVSHRRIDSVVLAWGGAGSLSATSMVATYLTRSRRFRAVGFAIGWSLPLALMILRGTAYPSESVVMRGLYPTIGLAIFTGAIVGHEMTYRTRSAVRTASFERRDMRRYLPVWMLATPLILGTVALCMAGLTLVVAEPQQPMLDRAWAQVVSVTAMAAVLIVGYLALGAIAHRRQNLDSEEELSVDETGRAFGSEVVWRATVAVTLVTIGSIGWMLDFVRSPGGGTWLPNWVMFIFVGCGLVGYGMALAAAVPHPRRFTSRREPVAAS